jgi:PAS domain S-box-containing protein
MEDFLMVKKPTYEELEQRVKDLEEEAAGRKHAEEALERRLSYEQMLGNIFGRALLVDEIDEFLDSCLNIMGDKLDVSRIYIFEHHYETDTMDNTFEWAAQGISPQKDELQGISSSAITWFMDMMKNNQTINYKDIEDIPGEQEKEILRPQKIKSILVVPLFIEREYYGFMGFDECKFHREWTDEDINVLRTIAQIITGTLEQKWADEKEIRYVNDLASLSKGATALVELSPEEDIYHVIGKHLKEIIGDSIVFVNSFDSASERFCVRQALGLGEHMETVLKLIGRNPVGMTIPISNEAKLDLIRGKLENVPGGLHGLSVGKVPKAICQAIEKLLGLGGAYAMGFAWGGELFGSTSFLMRRGAELKNECIIETFVRQASVALQRRQAKEALRASAVSWEVTFDAITDSVCLIDVEGKILQCNKATANFLRKPINEIVGNTCWELFHGTSEPIEGCPIVRMQETLRPESLELAEGDRVLYVATDPILDQDDNLAKIVHTITDITERKQAEEALQRAHDELEKKVEERTSELSRVNEKLKNKTINLEEANTALKVLLEKRGEDKIELEEKVLSNVKGLIFPYIENLKMSRLDDRQMGLLGIIESNLNEIITPFLRKLSSKYSNLTPKEIQIAGFVKEGKTSKEIAELLDSSKNAIEFHRRNLRKKLGIRNTKTNLSSYLLSRP